MGVDRWVLMGGLVAALLLGGCGGSTPPPALDAPVEEAAAVDLDETIRRCREQREQMDNETCAEARRAYRDRFIGDGKSKYAPGD